MPEPEKQTRAQQLIGDFAPKLVSLTDDVLFGDIWARTELSPRNRSLITVAALISGGNTEQLTGHLERARQNGLTETELNPPDARGARDRLRPLQPARQGLLDRDDLTGHADRERRVPQHRAALH